MRSLSYAFYSVQKGMTWLVYPRDICGVQKNYRSSNGEILIVQTSVDEPDLAPLQSGQLENGEGLRSDVALH